MSDPSDEQYLYDPDPVVSILWEPAGAYFKAYAVLKSGVVTGPSSVIEPMQAVGFQSPDVLYSLSEACTFSDMLLTRPEAVEAYAEWVKTSYGVSCESLDKYEDYSVSTESRPFLVSIRVYYGSSKLASTSTVTKCEVVKPHFKNKKE